MHIVILRGKSYISTIDGDEQVLTPAEDGAYEIKGKMRDLRTYAQNRALHLYFRQVADALSGAGLDIKKVIKADVSWTMDSVKNLMWRPLQEALLNKKSTAKLKKDEIDAVYDVMNRVLGEKYGIHVPFPSEESLILEQRLKETA